MQEVYTEAASVPRSERRGVSRKTIIDAAKEAVPVIDLADLLCGPGKMRRIGRHWVAKCPLPTHGFTERTPSFKVDPERNTWRCYGACQRGGDIVDLAVAAWGYGGREMAMAAADVLREFGHEIPNRPESWYRKQKRQQPIRNGIEDAIIRVARRRLYSRYFEPIVLATVDREDRDHDAQLFWELTAPLAELLVANMMTKGER
jgi:hypothetical protein